MVKGRHGPAAETDGAGSQKVVMSGLSSFFCFSRAATESHGLTPPSSCLTFDLDEGWSFVETEDWRPDITGSWLPCGADESETLVLLFDSYWIHCA